MTMTTKKMKTETAGLAALQEPELIGLAEDIYYNRVTREWWVREASQAMANLEAMARPGEDWGDALARIFAGLRGRPVGEKQAVLNRLSRPQGAA